MKSILVFLTIGSALSATCRRNVPTARESPLIAATGVSVMRDAKHSQWWDFLEGMAVIGSAMLGAVVLYLATGLLSIHLA